MNQKTAETVFEKKFFLTAGESDARGEMPMTLVAERVIEVATNHANILGIGYANLSPEGVGWVLSRLSVSMDRIPKINESYTIKTWIENWTRMFSERCFLFEDSQGHIIGYARTVWAIIDIKTRRVADLSKFGSDSLMNVDMSCPLPRIRNLAPVCPTETMNYTFQYTDLDFNRHVNTVRYIEHILNLWSPEHYDAYRLKDFEISFRHECLAGQTVKLCAEKHGADSGSVDIIRDEERVVSARLGFIEDKLSIQIPV